MGLDEGLRSPLTGLRLPTPNFWRQAGRDPLATVTPIDITELGIDGQDDTVGVDLGHADQASVGQVPPIPLQYGLDRRDFVLQAKARCHHASRHQLQDGLRAARKSSNQVRCLREYGLAGQEWGSKAPELLDRPGMVTVTAVQEGDEGPRVNDDRPQRP
jgi:hypothetical protein